jgi:WS/DGAT/MGAT family acyltransferase
MKELSGLDASFLTLETAETPMHNGMVTIFEGAFTYDELSRILEARVHKIRSFYERLVETPLNLDKPYWVADPDFDLRNHLRRVKLPAPGTWEQLQEVVALEFSDPMDREHPLWEIIYIHGVNAVPFAPEGSVALISKVHHAAADGISGSDIMNLLFDESPDVGIPTTHTEPPAENPPSKIGMAVRSGVHVAKYPWHVTKLMKDAATTTARGAFMAKHLIGKKPTVVLMAPKTPINVQIDERRLWDGMLLSLNRIKAIKNATDAKVNDVVLEISAGALRGYLEEVDGLPDKSMIAMVPVSVRPPEHRKEMGNEISAMFVHLCTDVEDPLERMHKIHEETVKEKSFAMALDAHTLMDLDELPPFALAGPAVRLYTLSHLADMMKPVWNCAITNVPGPQIPLYLAGKRLLMLMGLAPVFHGVGLTLVIFSYNGILGFSPVVAQKAIPDLDLFMKHMRDAAIELDRVVLADDDEASIVLFSSQDEAGESHRCWHTDAEGNRCHNHVKNGSAYCHAHQPGNG